MKIIEKHEPEPRQVKCRHCHSVLQPDPEDIYSTIAPYNESQYYFICPVCNQRVMLPTDPHWEWFYNQRKTKKKDVSELTYDQTHIIPVQPL